MFHMVGSPIILDFEVRNSLDLLTTPLTVQFWWRIGSDGAIVKSTVPSVTGVGLYQVVLTPDRGGTLFWRFKTDTPTVVSDGREYIEAAEFDEQATWGNSQWV